VTTTDVRTEPPIEEPAPSRAHWAVVIGIAIVVVAGVGFRFATRSHMWLDEALSVNIAHLSTRHIFTWLKHDGAPPLYYVVLHYWMKVFGSSNLGARSLSGVATVASFPLAYFCGKRIAGRAMGWIAVVVLSVNAYVVIYATTARMYALEQFLVFAGILAVRRAFEKPTVGRVALVGFLVAVLIYTQYWGFYITAALVLLLLGTFRYAPEHADAAKRLLVSVFVGLLTFIPWLPTFLYQAKHTGTPWGKSILPAAPIGMTFQDFAGGQQQEGWILLIGFIVLLFLGAFGIASRAGHIDVDLKGQPTIRWEAAIGAATLVIGTTLTYLSHNAFQSRYASVVVPFFVLVIARGILCFRDARVRALFIVAIVVLGWVGDARNFRVERTSATKVAPIINREGQPGDVVLYCPDQVGPAVHRLLHKGFDEMTYPRLLKPALVDWVDYKAVLRRHKPADVAQQVLDLAGDHTIWYVSAPGYMTHKHSCDEVSTTLAQSRKKVLRVQSDPNAFEKQGLQEFPGS
jgi:4-amino-4-deoxy-L-arabinose transferase-like glycosyltransferase